MRLNPSFEIVVAAGQTVFSTVAVGITAHIYPHSGLGYIQNDDFWSEYL